jgi:hypothetical protein
MNIANYTVYLFMKNIFFFLTMHEQNVDLHSFQIFNESQNSVFLLYCSSLFNNNFILYFSNLNSFRHLRE